MRAGGRAMQTPLPTPTPAADTATRTGSVVPTHHLGSPGPCSAPQQPPVTRHPCPELCLPAKSGWLGASAGPGGHLLPDCASGAGKGKTQKALQTETLAKVWRRNAKQNSDSN